MGVPNYRLLHRTGLEPEMLHNPATRVTLKQTLALAENALQLSGNAALGLKVGSGTKPSDDCVATMAIQAAGIHFWQKTRLIERYHKLFGQILLPRWTTEQDQQVYRVTPPEDLGPLLPFFVEEAFSAVLEAINRNYRTRITPTTIRLSYAEPEYAAAYHDYFGCPIQFNATHNEFVFNFLSLSCAERPAHPLNLALYQEMCEALDQRVGLVDQVRTILVQNDNTVTMEDVAKQLAMNARTLSRRLNQYGQTYQSLKDDVRIARSQQLLRHTSLSIDHIAEATGFSSTRRFRDFFSRHIGQTPSVYRRNAQNAIG